MTQATKGDADNMVVVNLHIPGQPVPGQQRSRKDLERMSAAYSAEYSEFSEYSAAYSPVSGALAYLFAALYGANVILGCLSIPCACLGRIGAGRTLLFTPLLGPSPVAHFAFHLAAAAACFYLMTKTGDVHRDWHGALAAALAGAVLTWFLAPVLLG